MELGNHQSVTDFMLLGLTKDPTLYVIFFCDIFSNLCCYLGRKHQHNHINKNLFSGPHTHAPLPQPFGFSSSITPIMLIGFLRYGVVLPVTGCEAQFCSGVLFGTAECFLLAAMADDRYVAVCSPLLYSIQMSPRVCNFLVAISYLGGYVNSLTFGSFLVKVSFCGPNEIDHFFCDFSPLLKFSCSYVSTIQIIPSISSGSIIVITVFVISISYICILTTILKMHSTEEQHKAFSPCTSHLTVVTLCYGTTTFIYVLSKSLYTTNQKKIISIFYTVVIPMLNPLIYSLRNKDVKEALRKSTIRIYS